MDNIETNRLVLRKFQLSDAKSVFRFMTNLEVSRFTGDGERVKTLEDATNIITDIWLSDYKQYGYGRLALIEKLSHELIGFCGLKYLPEFDLPDLGYRMLPQFWGKGYATEAAKSTLSYGVNSLNMEKVMGLTFLENTNSQRVLKKLGFIETDIIELDGQKCTFFLYETRTNTGKSEEKRNLGF